MSTSTTQTTSSRSARMQLTGTDPIYGDFRDDLCRYSYAVVKGAIPRARADGNLGFDRKDLSTVHEDKLPIINEKGMRMHYSGAHEDFVWKVRSEPGVLEAFEKVYDTQDIIVSFDAVNLGFPNRKDLPPNKPWPHQDQDPTKPGFRCLQGLVNLLPNGPNDGGLIVCRGAHRLSSQFHEEMADEEKIPAWTNEWYGFTENGMKWLESKGCDWIKVCAEPGDLLLWDSRTPHYNLSSTTSNPRFCIYTCFMSIADASENDLLRKRDAFEARVGTTHWPNARHVGSNVAKRNGELDVHNRERPLDEPVLSERAFKLTGIPYIASGTTQEAGSGAETPALQIQSELSARS